MATSNRTFLVEEELDRHAMPGVYIELYGWSNFVLPPPSVNESLVTTFYAELSQATNDVVVVRGRNVDISVNSLRQMLELGTCDENHEDTLMQRFSVTRVGLLGPIRHRICEDPMDLDLDPVPNSADQFHFSCSKLKRIFQVWHKFVSHNIIPSEIPDKVTMEHAILLAIQQNVDLDLGQIIHDQMLRCVRDLQLQIWFYPRYITKLMKMFGVAKYRGDYVRRGCWCSRCNLIYRSS